MVLFVLCRERERHLEGALTLKFLAHAHGNGKGMGDVTTFPAHDPRSFQNLRKAEPLCCPSHPSVELYVSVPR
jgi:hypothetical protein